MVAGIGGSSKVGGLLSNINKSDKEKESAFAKLSSGKRINKAQDDAAGLAILASLEAEIAALDQVGRNVGDMQSLVDITDGALQQVSGISTRMQELAAQSANGTYSDEQRAAMATEFNALREEVSRISETTEFNGISLLSGETVTAQVGTGGDANSQINLEGANISGALSDLETLDISTAAGAQTALDSLSTFTDDISSARADLGAASSRLSAARNSAEDTAVASEQAASAIRDVDVADEAARLVAANIRGQAGSALAAQANQNATTVLRLLQ